MDVVAQNIHWLIPEETTPCDIFLHFRGQNAPALAKNQIISFDFLQKVAKAQSMHIYVRADDLDAWKNWIQSRHPTLQVATETKPNEANLFGNKRAEFMSFVQKSIKARDSDIKTANAYKKSIDVLQKVTQMPMLDWYFKQFHEPPDLFQHNARITFALAIFYHLYFIVDDRALEDILFSSIIHELEGDPVENLKTVVSTRTLEILESNKHPVPQQVIELIRTHDELVSGAGFPNHLTEDKIPKIVKAFAIFNHFDHYRLKASGTRRARFDAAKKQMEARIVDYDSHLWPLFWEFLEKKVELVA